MKFIDLFNINDVGKLLGRHCYFEGARFEIRNVVPDPNGGGAVLELLSPYTQDTQIAPLEAVFVIGEDDKLMH